MSNASVGFKFGADIEQSDGHLAPMTCYVANTDEAAAQAALLARYPNAVPHPGAGQAVSAGEWTETFGAAPEADEVRCV